MYKMYPILGSWSQMFFLGQLCQWRACEPWNVNSASDQLLDPLDLCLWSADLNVLRNNQYIVILLSIVLLHYMIYLCYCVWHGNSALWVYNW